ncbi:general secretion pathway protein L [Sphingomonas gellani]|uniref:General secretion pathway protein L n=1 Tax=Sphingomonas gellani TaxID=1166340 RepID=A0A1H7YB42_9SPHN|nr:type II secretion system protein GspL [Sphingomonas gellani]SEM42537.1 general secretion pathway protein L [Sphingomonas gellani]
MTTLLFLPGDGTDWRWLRFADGMATGEGEGVPEIADAVIAVAPAEDVTLHWAELPSRSPAQAAAAARILVAEASAEPVGDLHVAVGEPDSGPGGRAVAVVSAGRMRDWLVQLAAIGVDPDAIVPASLLLPEPEQGFVRAAIAGRGLVRGASSGFADEPGFTELVTGGVALVDLDDEAREAGLIAATARPPLDLRQGAFARRRRFAIDWALVRRLVVLAGIALLLTLAVDVMRIVRLNLSADRAEMQADALARTGLPRGETVTDAGRQLDERLSRLRGPGRGFSESAAAVFAVIQAQQGAELTAMTFEPNGDLHIGLATQSEAGPTDVKRALEAAGLTVSASTFTASNGRVTGEMTVGAR